MALTAASRASAVYHLDIRYLVKANGKYVFKFQRLHESWPCGKAIPSLDFFIYIYIYIYNYGSTQTYTKLKIYNHQTPKYSKGI